MLARTLRPPLYLYHLLVNRPLPIGILGDIERKLQDHPSSQDGPGEMERMSREDERSREAQRRWAWFVKPMRAKYKAAKTSRVARRQYKRDYRRLSNLHWGPPEPIEETGDMDSEVAPTVIDTDLD